MNRDAELKRLTQTGRFYARTNAAPERRVEKDDVDRCLEHVRRELLEADDNRVRRQRHPHFLARATHAVHPEDRILEIVVVDVLDVLPEPDRLLRGPHRVRVEAEGVVGHRLGERSITFQLVRRAEDAALQFMGPESVRFPELQSVLDELLTGAHFAGPVAWIWIAKKQI